jgi:cysteine-rich repeat protein
MTLGTCLSALIACNETSPPGYTFAVEAGMTSEGTHGETAAGQDGEPPAHLTNSTTEGPACGDGVIDPGEGCDDGNLAPDDGCDATCWPEAAVEWTYTHNGGAGQDDVACGVAIDGEGRVFVVGAEVVQSRDAWIVALAPEGHELWRKTIDSAGFDDAFADVAVDAAGRVYAAGHEELVAGVRSPVIRAFTGDGADLWKFSEAALAAGGSGIDGLALADGALYSTGSQAETQVSLAIRRHDPASGAAAWKTTTVAEATNAYAGGIAESGAQMLAAGSAEIEGVLHPLLVRVEHDGSLAMTQVEAAHAGAWSDVVAIGGEGEVLVSGRIEPTPGAGFDVAVRRISGRDVVRWSQTLDHVAGFDVGRGAAVGAGEEVFVAGSVTSVSGDLEIFGARLSGPGELRWTHVNANPGPGLDDHGAAAAFGPGFVVLAGDEQVAGEGANVWVRRFRAE